MPPSISGPHWAQLVSWLSTPFVALVALIFGGYIAWRQWKTIQDRLKLDLFDRRFAVYETARKFLGSITFNGRLEDEEVSNFIIGIQQSKWLFNDEINNYLRNEICNEISMITTLNMMLEDSSKQERKQYILERSEIIKWFLEQSIILEKKMEPFLKLKH